MAYNSNFNNGNYQKASEKYKNPKYGQIVVTVTPQKTSLKDKEPSNFIYMYNLGEEERKEIINRLNQPEKATVTAWIPANDPSVLVIKVHSKDADKWLDGGDLNSIQSALIKSGKYNADEVAHLEDEIATGLQLGDTKGKAEIEAQAMETANQLWEKYLSTINNPVTMKQLELYQQIYHDLDKNYGHILSMKNAQMIRAQHPDATFVCAKGEWYRNFGRGVKRGAKPIAYWTWVTSEPSKEEVDAIKNQTIWKDDEYNELSRQVSRALIMAASQGKKGRPWLTVGYDYKDTYLLQGATDRFNTEIGLRNNLNGELNDLAVQKEMELGKIQDAPEIDGKSDMDKRTEMAVNYMKGNASEFGIKASVSENNNNALADMIYEYCFNNSLKAANILKKDNAETFAGNATKVTLILTNLALPALSRFNKTYQYSRREAIKLMTIVFGITKKLMDNTILNEGIFSWLSNKAEFIKRFIAALKQIGCSILPDKKETPETENTATPEQIKESFYDLYNRMLLS